MNGIWTKFPTERPPPRRMSMSDKLVTYQHWTTDLDRGLTYLVSIFSLCLGSCIEIMSYSN